MRLFQPFTQEMLGAATRFIRLEIEAEHLRSAHGLAKKRADDLEAKLEAAKKALEGAQSKVTAEEEKRAEERSKLAAEEEKRGEEKSRMVARDEKIHQCHEELNTSFIKKTGVNVELDENQPDDPVLRALAAVEGVRLNPVDEAKRLKVRLTALHETCIGASNDFWADNNRSHTPYA